MTKAFDMQPIRLGIWIGAIVLASFVTLLFAASIFQSTWNDWCLGYFYGMFFTHPVLSAVWAGLGPGSRRIRFVGSVVWLLTAITFSVLIVWMLESTVDEDTVMVIAASSIAQWLIVIPLLSILAWQFGVKIRYATSAGSTYSDNQSQFGIRHLLGLMSGIALLIGAGRALLPFLKPSFDSDVVAFLAYLGCVSAITQVPLLLAILFRRYVILAVLLAFIFIAIVTVVENPIQNVLSIDDLDYSVITMANTSSAVLVSMVAGMLRWHGFRLIGHTRQPLSQSISAQQTTPSIVSSEP